MSLMEMWIRCCSVQNEPWAYSMPLFPALLVIWRAALKIYHNIWQLFTTSMRCCKHARRASRSARRLQRTLPGIRSAKEEEEEKEEEEQEKKKEAATQMLLPFHSLLHMTPIHLQSQNL